MKVTLNKKQIEHLQSGGEIEITIKGALDTRGQVPVLTLEYKDGGNDKTDDAD